MHTKKGRVYVGLSGIALALFVILLLTQPTILSTAQEIASGGDSSTGSSDSAGESSSSSSSSSGESGSSVGSSGAGSGSDSNSESFKSSSESSDSSESHETTISKESSSEKVSEETESSQETTSEEVSVGNKITGSVVGTTEVSQENSEEVPVETEVVEETSEQIEELTYEELVEEIVESQETIIPEGVIESEEEIIVDYDSGSDNVVNIQEEEIPIDDNVEIPETIPEKENVPQDTEEQPDLGNKITGYAGSSGIDTQIIPESNVSEEYYLEIVDRKNEILESKQVGKGKHDEHIKAKHEKLEKLLINEFKFKNLEVYGGKVQLKLDVAEVNIPDVSVVKAFGVDPTSITAEYINLTITAQASNLFKCKEWSFTEGVCNGSWEKIKDLTVGENYTLTLTKDDPGFGEGENASGCIGYFQNDALYDLYNSPLDPCVDYKDFFVNKTGYQVTNELNVYVAKQKQCFYFDGDKKCSIGELFEWNESTDNTTYANITGFLNKTNYEHKIRYHLNQEDRRLLIYQGVKNKWKDIEEFAFGYIHYDIKLNNDTENDYVRIDGIDYVLDEDVNITPVVRNFTLFDPNGGRKIIVDWVQPAVVRVKDRDVELYFGPVPFDEGDTKQVRIWWYDPVNPVYTATRYVYDITDCSTLSCNQTGGVLKGVLNNNQNITLKNDRQYRITVQVQQIQQDATGTLTALIRDIGLGKFAIQNNADHIFDFNSSGVNDTDPNDRGNFTNISVTKYYNFTGITSPSSTHNATNGSINFSSLGGLAPDIPGSTEFTTSMYNNVNSSDDIRTTTTANDTDTYHRFKFVLNETRWAIDEIYIRWEGQPTCTNVSLAVYDIGQGWVFRNATGVGGGFGDVNLTTNLSYAPRYVTENNEIYILAIGMKCTPGIHTLSTDFIEARVIAKPTVFWNPYTGIAFNNITFGQHVNFSYTFHPNRQHGEFTLNFTGGDPNSCGVLSGTGPSAVSVPCISIKNKIIMEPVPIINKIFTEPSKVTKSDVFNCQANITDTSEEVSIIYANFTITDPNGVKLLDNVNGTDLGNNIWKSNSVTASISGIYNCSVNASDSYTIVNDSISFTVPEPKGIISTTPGATPFYTLDSNPQICSGLKAGQECELNWTVNATGDIGRIYYFFTIFDPENYSLYINQSNTTKVEVSIK